MLLLIFQSITFLKYQSIQALTSLIFSVYFNIKNLNTTVRPIFEEYYLYKEPQLLHYIPNISRSTVGVFNNSVLNSNLGFVVHTCSFKFPITHMFVKEKKLDQMNILYEGTYIWHIEFDVKNPGKSNTADVGNVKGHVSTVTVQSARSDL